LMKKSKKGKAQNYFCAKQNQSHRESSALACAYVFE